MAVVALVLLSTAYIATQLQTPTINNQAGPTPKGDGPGAPRYIKQWRKMKINPDMPNYKQLVRELRRETIVPYQKTTASNLQNITELGPINIGGRTRSIIVDIDDDEHLIAGGVSGGVWHSYDAGDSWEPVSDQLPTLSVTDICQSPFDTDVLYFCTGEVTGNSADIDGDGIYKSTDGGLTWGQLLATNNDDFDKNWCIRHDPNNANTIYVGTGGEGLFKSTDGGDSFEQVMTNSPKAHVTDLILFDDGRVMAALRNNGVFESSDGSPGSFTEVFGGLPTNNFRRMQLAVCEEQPNNVYVAYEDQRDDYDSGLKGIWKSTDGGQNWDELPRNPEDDGIYYRFNWYAFAFEVAPDDPDFIVCGSVELGYTLNGGQNWLLAQDGHADNHTVTFDPGNNNRFYVGNDGGIYRYNKLTAALVAVDLNEGYNVTQYYAGSHAPTGETAWGGSQDNGTHAYFLGSANFPEIYGADGSFNAISQQNANLGYVSWQNGMILRTFNASSDDPNFEFILNELDGDDDFEIDDAVWFINPFYINPTDGNQVYFVTQERVWRSTNAGDNWAPVTTAQSSDFYACGLTHEANPTAYIGGESGAFYRLDDAETAQPGDEIDLRSSVPQDIDNGFIGELTPDPNDPSIVYACMHDYIDAPRLYRILLADTDAPIWQPVGDGITGLPEGLPVNSIGIHPGKSETHFVAGTDFGVWSTTDGGSTWTKETSIPNVPVAQVKIRQDGRVFIWTHGRGLWGADMPTTNVSRAEANAVPEIAVYPNPVQDVMTIDWPGAGNAASFVVTDAKGREVAGGRLGGQQRVSLGRLSPGVYVVRVTVGHQTAVKRIVKTN